jgi:hypothetical protein
MQMRDSEELRNYNPDRNVASFIGRWIGFIIVAAIALGAVGWVIRWASVPGQIHSPENVRQQWAFAYDYEESLKSTARQVCAAERAVEAAQLPDERAQRRTQVTAQEQNYFRIQAQYDARLRDAFRAKQVAPSDVSRRAPELDAMKTQVCK